MIEIILLIFGVIAAFRRPKLANLTSESFPGVDSAKFYEWQVAELRANSAFLWATWGAFVIKIGLLILVAILQASLSEDAAVVITVAIIVGWIVGLTIAAVFGSRAKKLRVAAGIVWPN
jgi:hypothetical protein